MNFLNGYKTYIVSLVGIGDQVVLYMQGKETLDQIVPVVFGLILAMTIRHGVSTVKNS